MTKDNKRWLVVGVVVAAVCVARGFLPRSRAAEKQPDHTSRVPKFTFGDALEEQEAQLKTNPLLARFAESRRRNLRDPHHPKFHFVAPENRMNDPNGLCCWQGRWHLFYQGYPPEDPRQHWGHTVSDDLIHWRDLPYAIYPSPERCCFSGATQKFYLPEEIIALAEENQLKIRALEKVSYPWEVIQRHGWGYFADSPELWDWYLFAAKAQ
jgi:hypothetical protein